MQFIFYKNIYLLFLLFHITFSKAAQYFVTCILKFEKWCLHLTRITVGTYSFRPQLQWQVDVWGFSFLFEEVELLFFFICVEYLQVLEPFLFVLSHVQDPTIVHCLISAYFMHFSFLPEYCTFGMECIRVKRNIKGIKND